MSTYKLIYHHITGPVESFKYMFHYGGFNFEDVRLTKDEFKAYQNNTTMLASNMDAILEIDGKKLIDTNKFKSIGRYLAKKCMLYGSNKDEALEIDAAVDSIEDTKNEQVRAWNIVSFRPHLEYHNVSEKMIQSYYYKPKKFFCLDLFEKRVQENDGYFACGKLSWADILYTAYTNILPKYAAKDVHKNHPDLKKLVDKVRNHPKIKTYLDKCSIIMPLYTLLYNEVDGYLLSFQYMFHYSGTSVQNVRLMYEDLRHYEDSRSCPSLVVTVLEFDGKRYDQFIAIGRYLAKKCMLYGSDEDEAFEIDATVAMIIENLRAYLIPRHWEVIDFNRFRNWADGKKMLEHMTLLENQVKENGGYFVRGKMSWPDILYAGLIKMLRTDTVESIHQDYPELKNLVEKVHANPSIKTYLENYYNP